MIYFSNTFQIFNKLIKFQFFTRNQIIFSLKIKMLDVYIYGSGECDQLGMKSFLSLKFSNEFKK